MKKPGVKLANLEGGARRRPKGFWAAPPQREQLSPSHSEARSCGSSVGVGELYSVYARIHLLEENARTCKGRQKDRRTYQLALGMQHMPGQTKLIITGEKVQIPLFSIISLSVAGAPSVEVLVLWGKMLRSYPYIGETAEPRGRRESCWHSQQRARKQSKWPRSKGKMKEGG